MNWTEEFSSWLETGDENAEAVLDWPWDVEVQQLGNRELIVATHPKVPYPLYVSLDRLYATVQIDLNYPTDGMEPKLRWKLYKAMLTSSLDYNMIKIGLKDDDCKLIILSDMDLSCVGKTEFHNTVQNMVFVTQKLITYLDLSEETRDNIINNGARMIQQKLNEGMSEEDLLDLIRNRVGVDDAETFLREIVAALGSNDKSTVEGGE